MYLAQPVQAFAIGKLKNVKVDTQYSPMDKSSDPRLMWVGPQRNLECRIQLTAGDVFGLLSEPQPLQTVRHLFQRDVYFTYGTMLFEALFSFDLSQLPKEYEVQAGHLET